MSCRQLRDEMVISLTVSIDYAEDAGTISRHVRQYLNDPDLMFRKFRYKIKELLRDDKEGYILDKHGQIQMVDMLDLAGNHVWGHKWKKKVIGSDGRVTFIDYDKNSYHDQWTGRGYYKSAAQNAMRVARTETNIAYRRSDCERWKQLDFVLGIRVELSHNHTKEMYDICDELKGDYPKDFVFDGWQPQCFCHAVPILIEPEEMLKRNKAKARGEEYTPKGTPVKDVPQGFKKWCVKNQEKILASRVRGTEPYFVRNNFGVIDKIVNPQNHIPTVAADIDGVETPVLTKFVGKTPQEVREFILKNIADNCTLEIKKSDLDIWNDIINQINERMQQFGLEKFTSIGKPRAKAAEASWDGTDNSLNLNIPYLRNKSAIKKAQSWKKAYVLYSFAYEDETDYVRAVIDHELGHKLMSKFGFSTEVTKAFGKASVSIAKGSRMFNEVNDILGYYASTQEKEYFAEAFAFYMGKNRDQLGQYTKAMMEEFIAKVERKLGRNPLESINTTLSKPSLAASHKKGEEDSVILIADDEITARVKSKLKNKVLASLTKEQKDNLKEIASEVGTDIVRPMTFVDIDSGNVNPKFNQARKYKENCALVVLAAEARARGLDVGALGVMENKKKGKTNIAYELGLKPYMALTDPTTNKEPNVPIYPINNDFNYLSKLVKELTSEEGRYYIGFDGEELNHMLNAYRYKGKLYIYDHQIDGSYDLISFMKKAGATSIEILRLNDLLIDKTFINQWIV